MLAPRVTSEGLRQWCGRLCGYSLSAMVRDGCAAERTMGGGGAGSWSRGRGGGEGEGRWHEGRHARARVIEEGLADVPHEGRG